MGNPLIVPNDGTGFVLEYDDNYYNFITERILRGTCLVFVVYQIPEPVVGWITGMDEETIQVSALPDLRIKFLNRDWIISTDERILDNKPYKIDDVPDKRRRELLTNVTSRIRKRAEEHKKMRQANQ